MPASKNLHMTDRSGSKFRTRAFDPLLPFQTGPMNGRIAQRAVIAGRLGERVKSTRRGHSQSFTLWLVRTVQDPQAEDLLFGLLWRLATVAGVAFGAEYLARLAMRRPFAALEAHAARRVMPIGPVESRSDDGAATSPGRRTARLWETFARLPLAAARLILEIRA